MFGSAPIGEMPEATGCCSSGQVSSTVNRSMTLPLWIIASDWRAGEEIRTPDVQLGKTPITCTIIHRVKPTKQGVFCSVNSMAD
jgi:hypothetical protein